jgi:DNA invertase Pin-like site-specific DNA recombinase
MKCRYVAYYRVSTDRQGQSGLGLEAQGASVKAYAASTGCEIVASYTEVESGRKSDRVELQKAMRHAKRARATLLIAKVDRLTRNLAFLANLMETKVPFLACDNPHADRTTIGMLAVFAEHEARLISQRTKDSLAAAKARGVVLGKNNLTPEGGVKGRATAATVNRALKIEAYADLKPVISALREQGQSFDAIARHLNAQGEQTRRGCAWNATAVRRVIV